MKQLLKQFPRLNDWYNVGPVQRAELEAFLEAFALQNSAITADGKLVKEADKVWVISSTGIPQQTSVQPLKAYTYYELFGAIPVSSSFSSKTAAINYLKNAYDTKA